MLNDGIYSNTVHSFQYTRISVYFGSMLKFQVFFFFWGGGGMLDMSDFFYNKYMLGWAYVARTNEPQHEISKNVVCATSKGSDQPAHMRSLIRAFASRLHILCVLSY